MSPALRRSIRLGLIGGVTIIYLGAVGMLERFNDRPILTGVIQLSTILIVIALAASGFLAGRSTLQAPSVSTIHPVITGALAGATVGLFGLLLEFLTAGLGLAVRSMFVSLSVKTADVLALGQGPVPGALLLVVLGGVVGALAGLLHRLDPVWRKVVLMALASVLTAALGAPLFKVMLNGLGIPNRWLFQGDGLTILGAVVVAVAFGALRWWLLRVGGARAALLKVPGTNERNANRIIAVLALAVLGVLPWVVNDFVSDVLGFVGLFILLGLGLNIVVGYAGLLDLGYVAFYAVGAYSVAILTARSSYLVNGTVFAPAPAGFTNFWIAIVVTVLIAVVIGVLIGAPVLRLRGDYLAIVTLGFGEIIRTMVLSDWLKPTFGGPQGLTEVAAIPFFGLNTRDPQILYYLIFAFAGLAFFVAIRLKESRVGRAWAAMREDEDVAEGMGVSVIKYKLLAFAAGAAVGCLGGAFFAAKLSVSNPGSFTLLVSINVLAVVVLGGMGSIPGVVVGSLVLVGLPELLREFGEFRLHIYGAILIAIMIFKPAGLIPDKRRAMELELEMHEPEKSVLTAAATEGVQ
jgi:branched-chain amino acid transport system permease protein